jgi:hypothetical protein
MSNLYGGSAAIIKGSKPIFVHEVPFSLFRLSSFIFRLF